MYHTHEATKRHDKVYALLGISSDDVSVGSLLPDYRVPWKELLRRLVKFLLSGQVSIKTWEDKEVAEIRSRGCVLGRVSRAESGQDGRQKVNIMLKNTLRVAKQKTESQPADISANCPYSHPTKS
jgi:hypothetical protein